MKALLIIAIVGSIVFIFKTPDIVVKHHAYTTYFNPDKMEPDSVSWDLTPEMLSCGGVIRHDLFAADPQIGNCPDERAYNGTLKAQIYRRGHMFNYDEAKCNDVDKIECFYMSNMLPQPQSFNAGDWASVEHQERKWAENGKIHVVAGGKGSLGKLPSGVDVPDSCWKAIYHDHQWDGYIMANRSTSHGHHLSSHVASFEDFKRRTGFHRQNILKI